jgi:putative ubiquitin-RnfH superfamily antitoxin RatB of RatAB toxin-antitoxin module
MVAKNTVSVEVVFSARARECKTVQLELPRGAVVEDAVRQSRHLLELDDVAAEDLMVGIGGRKVLLSQELRDGDRVDFCRPLKVDPKLARRQRFKRQGAKSAGLFANRRTGAKAGY